MITSLLAGTRMGSTEHRRRELRNPKLSVYNYVYLYFRENGTPCYVGKGKKKRIDQHIQDARKGKEGDFLDHIRDMRVRDAPIRRHKVYEGLPGSLGALYVESVLIAELKKLPGVTLFNDVMPPPEKGATDYVRRHWRNRALWRLEALTDVHISERVYYFIQQRQLEGTFRHLHIGWRGYGDDCCLWADAETLSRISAIRRPKESYSRAVSRFVEAA